MTATDSMRDRIAKAINTHIPKLDQHETFEAAFHHTAQLNADEVLSVLRNPTKAMQKAIEDKVSEAMRGKTIWSGEIIWQAAIDAEIKESQK